MLYRAAAVLIVIFWIAMTALFVRSELSPGVTELSEVPVAHVMKLMFHHGQVNDLNVYGDRQMVGELRFHPQIRAEDGMRLLEYSGRLLFTLPGTRRQRVAWAGAVEMSPSLEMQSARLQITLAEPSNYAVTLTVDPRAKRVLYESESSGRAIEHGSYSLDSNGAHTWLRDQGIDPALVESNQASSTPGAMLRAWKSTMQIHGHELETYRVAIEHSGQTLLEFHVSQIGQVLQAKTIFGYTAAPEDHLP